MNLKYVIIMKNILILFITAVFLSVCKSVNAQPNLELSIVNQAIVGTDFYFEIQMQTTSGTVYLGSADIVLTFNSENFTNPVVTKGTFGSFLLDNTTGNNETQSGSSVGGLYRSLVSTASIVSNEIVINLNLLSVPDQETFNSDVAKITSGTYSFGTYKVSGVSNPSGTMGLAWKTSGNGIKTNVLSYSAAAPWNFSLITLSTSAIINTPLPVELVSLTAVAANNSVNIQWTTETEINNYGFEIERLSVDEKNPQWKLIGFVEGHGNSNSPKNYSFTDVNPPIGDLEYRLKQIDHDGKYKYCPAVAEVNFNVADVMMPKEFELSQNYPNPFNPSTKIKYAIPSEESHGSVYVQLKIYDVLGNELATLVNAIIDAGYYEVEWNAVNHASGIYFYTIDAKAIESGKIFRSVKKMLLIK